MVRKALPARVKGKLSYSIPYSVPSWYKVPRRARCARRKKRMDEPLTEELLDELVSSPNPDEFIEKYNLEKRSLSEYLQKLLEEKGLVRSEVIKEALLDNTYGYELFTGGKKHPGRNKILQIAFAMHLSLRETERLLQAAGVNKLYPKNKRDVTIIFALNKKYSLQQVNEMLFSKDEETIC